MVMQIFVKTLTAMYDTVFEVFVLSVVTKFVSWTGCVFYPTQNYSVAANDE